MRSGLLLRVVISSGLAACGAADRDPPPGASNSPGPYADLTGQAPDGFRPPGRRPQGFQTQGFQTQGFQTQGTTEGSDPIIKAFRLSSLIDGGTTVDQAWISDGSLVVMTSDVTGTTASLSACPTPVSGPLRSCGWRSGGKGTCTPGATVNLGSGSSGTCGSCAGATMVRVCSGTSPCERSDARLLAENAGACGTSCAAVTFGCPSSGAYNVLIGPYASGAAATLALRPSTGVYPVLTTRVGASLAGRTIEAELVAGGTRLYQIAEAGHELGSRSDTTYYRYRLRRDAGSGNFVDLCGPDADGFDGAIVVPGYWTSTGAHVHDPASLTFSCAAGVVAKCVRWGFDPLAYSWTDTGDFISLEDVHQACTRMARADYCGNGVSYTRNGTWIDVWDHLSPHLQSRAPPSSMTFEAAWTVDQAACLSHTRWAFAPIEVFTDCKALDDPQDPGSKRTCDSEQDGPWVAQALLFNESNIHVLDGGMEGGP